VASRLWNLDLGNRDLPESKPSWKLGPRSRGEVGGCDLVGAWRRRSDVRGDRRAQAYPSISELVLKRSIRAGACDAGRMRRCPPVARDARDDERYAISAAGLAFGMLAVTNKRRRRVIVKRHKSPRRDPQKTLALVAEAPAPQGRSALGGSTRAPIMTAYRQQAMACRSACPGAATCARSKARDSRSPENPTAQRLWLVRRCERGIYVMNEADMRR